MSFKIKVLHRNKHLEIRFCCCFFDYTFRNPLKMVLWPTFGHKLRNTILNYISSGCRYILCSFGLNKLQNKQCEWKVCFTTEVDKNEDKETVHCWQNKYLKSLKWSPAWADKSLQFGFHEIFKCIIFVAKAKDDRMTTARWAAQVDYPWQFNN